MVYPYLPILIPVLQPQLNVLAQGLAFLLDEVRHDRKQHLAPGIHSIDILFFPLSVTMDDRGILFILSPRTTKAAFSKEAVKS